MNLHLRFWKTEIPLRMRGWWLRHWWPAVIRRREAERDDWRRWCEKAETQFEKADQRWWCRIYNEFGNNDSKHPHCHPEFEPTHNKCGYGLWIELVVEERTT